MADPIRIPSCRPAGSGCWLCGDAPWPSDVRYLLPCGCWWHLMCGEDQSITRAQHLSDLLAEAIRQRDAASERETGTRGPHVLVHKQLLKQLQEERDAALRKGAAERAMLDEIIALPDIEEQDGENVAMWVANALEAMREERDAAKAKAERAQAALSMVETEMELNVPEHPLLRHHRESVLAKVREALS